MEFVRDLVEHEDKKKQQEIRFWRKCGCKTNNKRDSEPAGEDEF